MIATNHSYRIIFLLTSLALALPIFFIGSDSWDGTIINHAFRRDDLSDLKSWFFESRWNLQYFLYAAIHLTAKFTNIPHEVLLDSLTVFPLMGIAYEAKILAKNYFKISESGAWLAAYLTLLYPGWNAQTSAVMVIYPLCAWLSLLGSRTLIEGEHPILGILICTAGLQLNSTFAFVPALLFSYAISSYFVNNQSSSFKTFASITLVLAITFFVLKTNFPPYGPYENYNRIELTKSLDALSHFSTYILFYGAIPLTLTLYLYRNFSRRGMVNLIMITAIIFGAIIPYIAVGKYPYSPIKSLLEFDFDVLTSLNSWSIRHGILLSVPIAILSALSLDAISNNRKPIKLVFSIFSCCTFLILLFLGFFLKAENMFYKTEIKKALRDLGYIDPAIVYIRMDAKLPAFQKINSYGPNELNTTFEKAYGFCGWHSYIGSNELIIDEIPKMFYFEEKFSNSFGTRYCFDKVDTSLIITLKIHQVKKASFTDILGMNSNNIFSFEKYDATFFKSRL